MLKKLAFRKIKSKSKSLKKGTWLFLHGFLGSGNNFRSLAMTPEMSGNHDIYLLDMRNHGGSFHDPNMSIGEMSEDVINFMDSEGIETASVLGHSMGGRVGIDLSLKHDERIDNLILEDIGNFDYWDAAQFPHIHKTLKMLFRMKILNLRNKDFRQIRDDLIKIAGNDERLASFLMTNIQHDASQQQSHRYTWRININALYKNYTSMLKHTYPSSTFNKPVLILAGTKSEYMPKDRLPELLNIFPKLDLRNDIKLFNSGHWLHHEVPDLFIKEFEQFNLENF